MFMLAWIALASLLYLYFDRQLSQRHNPNQQVQGQINQGIVEIQLQRNRQGHYVTSALINGQEVVMLVDTGATEISIPARVADRLGLARGHRFPVNTANGSIDVYQTRIDTLSIGVLTLYDLSANINPGLDSNTILLGMNALKDLELIQRGDTLTLRTY
ncbi:TIGR02281 family clan AA aspartic protease [Ferrimonas pelagia]|uniref:TIGR02281 family clan AA aspartic protease n=2 Tax=Ferrimonas pelagia TaxID=1177826 RepID=A0ABP9FFX7_9GAMM